jgi:hypothetical protein
MVSTRVERITKICILTRILLGTNVNFVTRKRPDTLPAGINYTTPEWILLENARLYANSIQTIWELEELFEKYKSQLLLVKMCK